VQAAPELLVQLPPDLVGDGPEFGSDPVQRAFPHDVPGGVQAAVTDRGPEIGGRHVPILVRLAADHQRIFAFALDRLGLLPADHEEGECRPS
jgi:hypothetical protein